MPQKIYNGTRWKLFFGKYSGIEKFAVDELNKCLQRFVPYLIEVRHSQEFSPELFHTVITGTIKDNQLIAEMVNKGAMSLPTRPGEYSIFSGISPWNSEARILAIAGFDEQAVLYGAQHINSILHSEITAETPKERQEQLNKLRNFVISEYPQIDNRGIWTWGYVIYDYQRFIDNLARLRMNMLTIWNDCLPHNINDIINYAHDRGVQIILGFHWGWGLDWGQKDFVLTNPNVRDEIKSSVLANWSQNYKHISTDGIYFQTLTEHGNTQIGDQSIASAACTLVNQIAGEILNQRPELYLQFGIHATSVLDNHTQFKSLDSRVSLVWEDAGVIPYSYNPVTNQTDAGFSKPVGIDSVDKTIEYSKKLAALRPNCEFAMVPKGWITLRWKEEFENHGPFILGQREHDFIKKRLCERQARWDEVNSLWFMNYKHAQRFYKELLASKPSRMTVTGLIEDGMFEECIQPSVALFSQMLWNPMRDSEDILDYAMNPYYKYF
jgi:hypothetical protein